MASTRQLKRRIRATKGVSKVTRAMEMVSAAKMRRAQRNVLATRPYADRMIDVMGELTARMRGAARRGTLLEERDEIKHVAVIVVTPDRGLAGSLVTNILRRASRFVLEQREQGRDVSIYALGKKGRDFLVRNQWSLSAEVTDLPGAPLLEDVLGIATNVVQGFQGVRDPVTAASSIAASESEGRYDEVYIIYSEFVNTLTQRPAIQRLLPIEPPMEPEHQQVDYTYEPSQEEVLEALLPRYVELQIYQALLESIASEHSARMVAMRNATENANDLVKDLTLTYNKARQDSITREVSEISAGAVALEG